MKTIVDLTEELKKYSLEKDTAAKQAVEANIAPVEADASSASRAYVEGEKLFLNDVRYDVTSPISVGDAIAVGTNITAANKLSADIQSKQDQIEVTTMPTASASNVGKVLIYIGATTSTYTSGQSYQSTLEGGNYIWKPTSISSVDASDVVYDNQTSGLTATDSQAAIDELASQNQTLTSAFANNVNVNGAKNLLPTPYLNTKGDTYVDSGLTFTENADGSITCSGTSTSGSMVGISIEYNHDASDFVGKTITASIENAVANQNAYCPLVFKDSGGTKIARYDIDSGHPSYTFTVPSNAVTYDFQIYVRAGKGINATLYPMICLATDYALDNTYVPYAKTNQQLTEDSVTWDNLSEVGAVNFAKISLTSQTDGIYTYTVADGIITAVVASATSLVQKDIANAFVLKKGTYKLSGIAEGIYVDIQVVNTSDSSVIATITGNDSNKYTRVFTLSSDTTVKMRLTWHSGISAGTYVFKPMIAPVSYNGPHVPPAKTNKELTDESKLITLPATKNDSIVDSFVIRVRKQHNTVYVTGYFNIMVAANKNDLLFTISDLNFFDANDHFYILMMSSDGETAFAEVFSNGEVKVGKNTGMPTGYYMVDSVLLMK